MPVDEKRQAAATLRTHARTLALLLNPRTARTVAPDQVRSAIACLRDMADALDRNADTEN